MAIVANAANAGANIPGYTSTVDQSFCSHNRSNAGEPNGSLTPQFAGEIVLDTTNNAYWKAIGTGSSDWIALTPPF